MAWIASNSLLRVLLSDEHSNGVVLIKHEVSGCTVKRERQRYLLLRPGWRRRSRNRRRYGCERAVCTPRAQITTCPGGSRKASGFHTVWLQTPGVARGSRNSSK